LSKRIIFGGEKNPQKDFNYRNLSEPVGSDRYEEYLALFGKDYRFRVWNEKGLPQYRDYIPGEVLPEGWSILPFFPGYTFDRFGPKGKKSFFMDDYGGEGGRTFSKPGIYIGVYDGDIASQYPHSIMAEMLFGPKFTKIFREIVEARVAVKHKDFETAGKLLNGALKPYLNDESAKDLAQALKIIINSIYGLTSASFTNEFKDERNIDNIVAKRGNLFMRVLQDQIENMGYTVCHIKTDSIKVADADQIVKDFIVKFGREYGYEFETEAEFSKFALLNDAAYVGKLKDGKWMFKADEFKPEIIRKTLFTHESVVFDDYCLMFATKDALYLDMNEGLKDVTQEEKRFEYLSKKLLKEEIPKGFSSLDEVEKEMGELDSKIREGHRLKFVGKVGQFTPVKSGCGGGELYIINGPKKSSVSGTKGYRWLESSEVKAMHFEDFVDASYFRKMVDEAKDDIDKLPGGNFEWFVADDDFINIPESVDKEVPFEE
jgi:flagellin-specific chaperone FliS